MSDEEIFSMYTDGNVTFKASYTFVFIFLPRAFATNSDIYTCKK